MLADDEVFYSFGTMTHDFWKEYIKPKMSKESLKTVTKMWSVLHIKDKSLDYYVISLPINKLYYQELWFLDIGIENYYVVLVDNINTSSPYALSRCDMDSENDCEFDENSDDPDHKSQFVMNIESILQMVCALNDKEAIKNIIINGIKKRIENS